MNREKANQEHKRSGIAGEEKIPPKKGEVLRKPVRSARPTGKDLWKFPQSEKQEYQGFFPKAPSEEKELTWIEERPPPEKKAQPGWFTAGNADEGEFQP